MRIKRSFPHHQNCCLCIWAFFPSSLAHEWERVDLCVGKRVPVISVISDGEIHSSTAVQQMETTKCTLLYSVQEKIQGCHSSIHSCVDSSSPSVHALFKHPFLYIFIHVTNSISSCIYSSSHPFMNLLMYSSTQTFT